MNIKNIELAIKEIKNKYGIVRLSEVIQKSRKISKETKEELLQSLDVFVLCPKETKFIGILEEKLLVKLI